ncbi:hypothetical protein JCGZ_20315 [Jatropha curcas]|uniref:Uncharacterized protein n=1 Tax=Jatropha curcas TaxID=180498 RepID=A0A067JT06_JATCU|nr:hypothetical protein JCGZ_20315 [Jatropha curcas]
MVHFGNSTSMCGSDTSAIFIYAPHRGQKHQIAWITLNDDVLRSCSGLVPQSMMLSCEVHQGKADVFRADQTEPRGCPFKTDWSRQSRSNRAEWVAR